MITVMAWWRRIRIDRWRDGWISKTVCGGCEAVGTIEARWTVARQQRVAEEAQRRRSSSSKAKGKGELSGQAAYLCCSGEGARNYGIQASATDFVVLLLGREPVTQGGSKATRAS